MNTATEHEYARTEHEYARTEHALMHLQSEVADSEFVVVGIFFN